MDLSGKYTEILRMAMADIVDEVGKDVDFNGDKIEIQLYLKAHYDPQKTISRRVKMTFFYLPEKDALILKEDNQEGLEN